jgi:hypothetical protein
MVHSGQKMSYIMNDTADGFSNTIYRNAQDYPSVIQGYGRIQMSEVLNFGISSSTPLNLFLVGSSNSSMPHYAALQNGTDVNTFTVRPSTNGGVRVTFSYTDAPGVAGAADVRTNRLLVTVRNTRSSQEYTPYQLTGGLISNLQVVDIPAKDVRAGDPLIITVKTLASVLAVAPQPYSLVVTGEGQVSYLPEYVVETYVPHTASSISFVAALSIACLGLVCLSILVVVFCFRRLAAFKDNAAKNGGSVSMGSPSFDDYSAGDDVPYSGRGQAPHSLSLDSYGSDQESVRVTLRSDRSAGTRTLNPNPSKNSQGKSGKGGGSGRSKSPRSHKP